MHSKSLPERASRPLCSQASFVGNSVWGWLLCAGLDPLRLGQAATPVLGAPHIWNFPLFFLQALCSLTFFRWQKCADVGDTENLTIALGSRWALEIIAQACFDATQRSKSMLKHASLDLRRPFGNTFAVPLKSLCFELCAASGCTFCDAQAPCCAICMRS